MVEAAEAGLYTLELADIWRIALRHPSKELRLEACLLTHCAAAALEGGESLVPVYLKAPCISLVQAVGRQSYLSAKDMMVQSCVQEANRTQTVLGQVQVVGDPPRPVVTASESELVMGLRSPNLTDRMATTSAALWSERGLEGIDWKVLRASGAQSDYRFATLLAIRLGCHWPGYCAANSVGMFPLCSGILLCRPGEDFWQVAQNNLSPIQFEQLRAARVAGGP